MKKPLMANYKITDYDIKEYQKVTNFKWYYFILPNIVASIILLFILKPKSFSEILVGILIYATFIFPILFFVIMGIINYILERRGNKFPNVKRFLNDQSKYHTQQYSKLSKYFEQLSDNKLKKELFRACQFSGYNPKKIDIDNFYIQPSSDIRTLFCFSYSDKELEIEDIEHISHLKTKYNATFVRVLAKSDFLYPYDLDKRSSANQLLGQNHISISTNPIHIFPFFTNKIEDIDKFINSAEGYQQLLSSKNNEYFLMVGRKLFSINADKLNPNKENDFEILLYNYIKRKNIYYLLNSSNEIIAEKDERDVISSNQYKKTLKAFDKEHIPGTIHKWQNYSFICENKTIEIDNFKELHQEYQEAVLIDEKNKMFGFSGRISKGGNGELVITKYSQYSIKDEKGCVYSELEFSPQFHISIKNNKFALLKKENNKTQTIVDYGVYDFIGCISETFLLVKKPNEKKLNDEKGSHWPDIPLSLYSIIDKYGNNAIQDGWYRYINVLNEKEVELCSGRNLDHKKVYNLYTQDEKFIQPSLQLPIENEDIGYTWHNNRYFTDNIVLTNVIKDNWDIGVKIIDISKGKIISKLFDALEFFDKEYCIVFDSETNQYIFVNSKGEISNCNNWKGSTDTEICIMDTYWYLKKEDKLLDKNKYDCIYPLKNNRAIAKFDESYGVIDENGNQIIDCIYPKIDAKNNEFFIVTSVNKNKYSDRNNLQNNDEIYILFDKQGVKLHETCEYMNAESIINTNNILVLPCEKKVFTIDGQIIVGNNLPTIYKKYSDKDMLKYSSSMNIYDIKTMELIKWYADVSDFEEGFAIVTDGDKYGFIDCTGKEIAPCVYDKLYPFKKGMAVALLDDEYVFINEHNKIINVEFN